MDASPNRAQENGSNKPVDTASLQGNLRFNVFDLIKVGLSSTIAIAILIGIGHVVKHVAGPSAILSILIAAFIAYFVGKLEIPLQRPCAMCACGQSECHRFSLEPQTIPTDSKHFNQTVPGCSVHAFCYRFLNRITRSVKQKKLSFLCTFIKCSMKKNVSLHFFRCD